MRQSLEQSIGSLQKGQQSSPEFPSLTPVHPWGTKAGRARGSFSDPNPFGKPLPSFPSESRPVSPTGNAVNGKTRAQREYHPVFFILFCRCLTSHYQIKE